MYDGFLEVIEEGKGASIEVVNFNGRGFLFVFK